ncbi:alpha/beta fold hydrolase [Streptomyces acidicola]|uniref:alpha/beta fold hydrolase n=1 Tax=Streptomyces acidicola TaxID=2596892 RepID=UPI0037995D0C
MELLLDGLGVGPTALCGHSYGAWIALHHALHHALHAPDQVRRLALLDPTGLATVGGPVGHGRSATAPCGLLSCCRSQRSACCR